MLCGNTEKYLSRLEKILKLNKALHDFYTAFEPNDLLSTALLHRSLQSIETKINRLELKRISAIV